MQTIISFNFLTVSRNPNFVVFPIRFALKMASKSSSSSSKIVAEYAKSGRSSCKQCSKAIAASALRLGLVSRGSGGFDMTKWHHLQCFPLESESAGSPESIKGFSALKVPRFSTASIFSLVCRYNLHDHFFKLFGNNNTV